MPRLARARVAKTFRRSFTLAVFWFLAGVLTTLATLILILPWLRKIALLGSLPAVPWQIAIAAVVMSSTVLGMYQWLGRPDLAGQPRAAIAPNGFRDAVKAFDNAAGSPGAAKPTGAGSMNSAIAALESRLAKGGGSTDDWELLAKSFEFLGRQDDAKKARAHQLPPIPPDGGEPAAAPAAPVVSAPTLSADSIKLLAKASSARQNKQLKEAAAIYAQLAARGQMNADSWADYADAAASTKGKLAGEPEQYIAKSLALNPQHPKALWLKASAAEEAGRYGEAVLAWQQLQPELAPDSSDAKIVTANLQQDQKLAAAAMSEAPNSAAPGPGTRVSGEVLLAAKLQSKAVAGETLFIVAKSVDSPGAPVAVFRSTVGNWPVKFTLDDSQSMLPGRNLSSAGRVTIEARISQSGQALPATGDLHGTTGVINPADHQPLKILIDQEIS
jgi:cytochrome c-type biogenesis protein CcmH/NrfG